MKRDETSGVDIRPFRASDTEAVRALRLESLLAEPRAFRAGHAEEASKPSSWWEERFSKALGETSPDLIMLALVDGRPVGLAWSRFAPGHCKINAVYVEARYRRHGLGRALVLATLSGISDRQNCDLVLLNVNAAQTGAIGLYESLGFELTGVEPRQAYGDGNRYDRLTMSKRL